MPSPAAIADLEQEYDSFYVPSFSIKVGGRDVVRDWFLTVSSVSVDLRIGAASTFSFSVANSFDWESRQFIAGSPDTAFDLFPSNAPEDSRQPGFRFGSRVEIAIGYGDHADLQPMLSGYLTEVTGGFSSGATPDLTVNGFDLLFPLTLGANRQSWEGDRTDSQIVELIAAGQGFDLDVEETSPPKPRQDKHDKSDLDFIKQLADRNAASDDTPYTFLLTSLDGDDTFYFGPRRYTDDAVVELEWGKGLVSFSPEVGLMAQASKVEVHGRVGNEEVVGVAELASGELADSLDELGSPTIVVRAAVQSLEDARSRAETILQKRAQSFVSGSAEAIGLPLLRPNTTIELGGMSSRFSKKYWISEVNHTFDSSGYKTTFKVEEPGVAKLQQQLDALGGGGGGI